jgi:hypothetical protein
VRRADAVVVGGLHGVHRELVAVPLVHDGDLVRAAELGVLLGAGERRAGLATVPVRGARRRRGAAASLGVTVNATRALALPGQCRVQTPPVSQCNDGELALSIDPSR